MKTCTLCEREFANTLNLNNHLKSCRGMQYSNELKELYLSGVSKGELHRRGFPIKLVQCVTKGLIQPFLISCKPIFIPILNVKNETIFESIDTKEKSYWLGFLMADGFILKNGWQVRLCLSTKDEDLLNKFINFVQGVESDKRYYGPYKTSGPQVHYTINSQQMVNDLRKYGCVYKKSLITEFPIFDTGELEFAFLLGYFDGDGTQGATSLTSGCYSFLEYIKTKYALPNKINNHGKNCYIFSLGVELFRKLLRNYEDSLPRKRIIEYKKHKCSKCENMCSKASKCCFKCKPNNNKKTFNDPPIGNLIEQIERLGYKETGKLYNVSDNSIKKRILRYIKGTDIPLPHRNISNLIEKKTLQSTFPIIYFEKLRFAHL